MFTFLGEVRSPGPGLRGTALVWREYLAKAVEENFKQGQAMVRFYNKDERDLGWSSVGRIWTSLPALNKTISGLLGN